MLRDLIRIFRTAPATTIGVVAVLTVSLTSATLVFTVVDHIAIRRLALPNPDRLIAIHRVGALGGSTVSPQDYFYWQQRLTSIDTIGASASWSSLPLSVDGETVPLVAARATDTLFRTIDVSVALGTGFEAQHSTSGNDRVAVLTDRIWRLRFNADPSIVGREIRFGTQTRRIIGVLEPGAEYPLGQQRSADIWIPMTYRPSELDLGSPGRSYFMHVVARLKTDASVEQAQREVAQVLAAPEMIATKAWREAWPVVMSLHDAVVGPAKGWLLLALATVGVVLLLAAANVANLLLARTAGRARDLAVRGSLGASAARLVVGVVGESLVLSLTAGVVGLAACYLSLEGAVAVLPAGLTRLAGIALDGRVFAVGLLMAVIAGLLAAIVPARMAWRSDIMKLLRRGAQTERSTARQVLVSVQLGFVVVLVFTTTIFVASFGKLTEVDLGFDHEDRFALAVGGPRLAAGTPLDVRAASQYAFRADALNRANAVPGVRAVALVDSGAPLSMGLTRYSIKPVGSPLADGPSLDVHHVTPGYADAAGLRLIAGRFLTEQDTASATPVAVLSEEGARLLFPTSAIDQSVEGLGATLRIVGVVQGARRTGPESEPSPAIYLPLAQADPNRVSSVSLFVRTSADDRTVASAVVASLQPLWRAGARPPVPEFLSDGYRRATADRRFLAWLMTGFGAVALFIGAFGVYGVLTALAVQQTKETGIRLALGASRQRIMGRVFGQSARFVATGFAGGLVAAWLAGRTLSTLVFQIAPGDPRILLTVTLVVTATAALASLLPAYRASRVDVQRSLRADS